MTKYGSTPASFDPGNQESERSSPASNSSLCEAKKEPPVASNSWLDRWIEACARLTRPDRIEWCTGSEEEYDSLAHRMLQDGTLIELNQKAYPNCYLHRSRSNDVARTEHLTSLGRSSRRSNFCHCLGKPAIQSCASRRFLKNPILKEGLNRQGAKNTKRFLEF